LTFPNPSGGIGRARRRPSARRRVTATFVAAPVTLAPLEPARAPATASERT